MRVWKASGTLDINKAMGRARRRMENRAIWIAVLFTVQFSGILCRNPYYEYYYSLYHKGHSTTEAISSSTSDNSYEEGLKSSVSDYTSLKGITGTSSSTTDDTSLENGANSSTVDHGTSVHTNVPVLQYGVSYGTRVQRANQQNAGLIIGIVLISLFITGIIICCCSCCLDCCCAKYCGKERKGYVVLSSSEATEARPQQNQPLPSNHAEETPQQFPTYYQSGPVHHHVPYYPEGQQQYQSNPATAIMQPHNFPEAPPPYDAPSYYKN